jgi:predicted Fe-Mo cluster-binding NifX family protein
VKIAIVTDDGRTVSAHFGRAAAYAVLTVEGGAVVAREMRPKFAPHGTAAAVHDDEVGQPHGTGPGAQSRHDQMAAVIADCEVVICRGMGIGAHQRLTSNGIRPIVTDIRDIDEAALECAAGTIVDHIERLH